MIMVQVMYAYSHDLGYVCLWPQLCVLLVMVELVTGDLVVTVTDTCAMVLAMNTFKSIIVITICVQGQGHGYV